MSQTSPKYRKRALIKSHTNTRERAGGAQQSKTGSRRAGESRVLAYCLLLIAYSLFPIPYSFLFIPYSRIRIAPRQQQQLRGLRDEEAATEQVFHYQLPSVTISYYQLPSFTIAPRQQQQLRGLRDEEAAIAEQVLLRAEDVADSNRCNRYSTPSRR